MSAPDAAVIRDFVNIIAAQAKAATEGMAQPGLLQVSLIHPAPDDVVPNRFPIDDIGGIIRTAMAGAELARKAAKIVISKGARLALPCGASSVVSCETQPRFSRSWSTAIPTKVEAGVRPTARSQVLRFKPQMETITIGFSSGRRLPWR
jgi:hypothetical protein